MTISVLTPAYKAEAYIARAVRSVLAQTLQHWEMIIISDDGQDYGQILRAQGIEDERLRFASTNSIAAGPSRARNIGMDHARYPFVSHLDADDRYDETFLEQILPALAQHGAVATSFRLIDEMTGEDMPKQTVLTQDTLLTTEQLLWYSFAYANIAFDTRRSHARWPEGMHFAEDLFLWFYLLDDIPNVAYLASPCYHYHYRHGSLSHSADTDMRLFYERRAQMIYAIDEGAPPIRNEKNRKYLRAWLSVGNELEELFNFTLVDGDVYRAEFNKRFHTIIGDGN